MENWGCIALNTNVFLNATEPNFRTIVHEVSHMWFGNLVTLEWWDDIWLNEGFARYFEYYILDKIRPEFMLREKYFNVVYSTAISLDKKFDWTHPVRLKVPEPDMLMNAFDEITYAKGSVLCRILNSLVNNEDLFQSILKKYMETYQWKCATTEDLLAIFDEMTG